MLILNQPPGRLTIREVRPKATAITNAGSRGMPIRPKPKTATPSRTPQPAIDTGKAEASSLSE